MLHILRQFGPCRSLSGQCHFVFTRHSHQPQLRLFYLLGMFNSRLGDVIIAHIQNMLFPLPPTKASMPSQARLHTYCPAIRPRNIGLAFS